MSPMPVAPTRMTHATLLPVSGWVGGSGHGVHVCLQAAVVRGKELQW